MATTSLKLPDDVKQRVIASAREQGISPHAFMLKAIEQAVSAAERRASFLADAKESLAETRRSGKGFEAREVHDYLKKRVENRSAEPPESVDWHE